LSYHDYRNHGPALLWFLLLSLLEQSGPVVGTWITARAFNIDLSLLESAAAAPAALLAADVVVAGPQDALALFLRPDRLRASLRR